MASLGPSAAGSAVSSVSSASAVPTHHHHHHHSLEAGAIAGIVIGCVIGGLLLLGLGLCLCCGKMFKRGNKKAEQQVHHHEQYKSPPVQHIERQYNSPRTTTTPQMERGDPVGASEFQLPCHTARTGNGTTGRSGATYAQPGWGSDNTSRGEQQLHPSVAGSHGVVGPGRINAGHPGRLRNGEDV
ncbi:Uu.00g002510.m01.CDS01 [Anthostomella pinea]|uniref:Uu.00g002510.m01.CDS01 n=1 Tax=Anthostomella pinea TaxID=933095 RepID=A0AAI8YII3_9PEZI|nr:Uu.00g002510.m01.CDS01 [Anthostomella pinea]